MPNTDVRLPSAAWNAALDRARHELHGATVLVTGGAGFIGSSIARLLVDAGAHVRVLDDLSTGRQCNLDRLAGDVQVVRGSILQPSLVREAAAGTDVIFHVAALPSVPRSVVDPIGTHEACATGTLQVLQAARAAGTRRVVYSSSSSAYGNNPQLPKREDMVPMPRSPYAVAKLTGEYYCSAFTAVYGLETVTLRYFNVFGPNQDPESPYAAVIPRFISGLLEGKPITIEGDGEQTRDFTYVDNAIHANICAALAPPDAVGATCNIACGASITIRQVLADIERLLGRTAEIACVPARTGDVRHSLADITRAATLLGYRPLVPFDEGLRRTIAAFTDAGDMP